jgi:peptide/nickel transport system permease protein
LPDGADAALRRSEIRQDGVPPMTRYILTRLWQGVVTLLVLVTAVFLLARVIGTPVDLLLPPDYSPAERAAMVHRLGLDQPVYVQYFQYMGGLLKGDFGTSFAAKRPVLDMFLEAMPNTLRLAAVTIVIALVFGFIAGVVSGTHRGSFIDQLLGALAVVGVSAPTFWIGLILILVFAVQLNLLPVARMGGPESYILPAVTWSLFMLAGTTRLVRSSMIDVLDSEFIKLARIKGVSEHMVVWKHCLRNALLPVITFTGVQIAALLNGSVVVESVFAWPGVGRLIYQGIVGRDYPLVQGCLLIGGFVVIALNLAVDLVYAVIDPRVRLEGEK